MRSTPTKFSAAGNLFWAVNTLIGSVGLGVVALVVFFPCALPFALLAILAPPVVLFTRRTGYCPACSAKLMTIMQDSVKCGDCKRRSVLREGRYYLVN